MPQSRQEKERAQKLLESFGANISKNELKRFEDKGFSVNKAQNYAQNQGGVRLGDNARDYVKAGGASSAQTTVTPDPDLDPIVTNDFVDFQGRTMSRDQFNVESEAYIRNLQGGIDKELEILRGSSNENIAGIQAGAQTFGYAADERARKYVADRAGITAENVENIRAKNNLDLQSIVNAGLKDVANIQGETSRDVEKTRGEFGLKQEETRQAGGRDIARIAGRAGIYQGLMGAFNF
jgi:hypothetical protein